MLAKTLFALLVVFSTNATAGGGGAVASSIVYDPTNHAENIVTAARSVYAETQRATQIYNQLTQYRHMLMQAQGMDPTVLNGLLSQNGQDMRAMQTYIGGMSTLLNDSNKLKEMALNRAVDWGNSGLTFEDYAKQESDRIANGDKRRAQLQQQEFSTLKSVNQDIQYVQDVQRQIPGATASQSAEIMNSQLNRLVAQNSTIISLQASNGAIEKQAQAEKEKNQADLDATLKKRQESEKKGVTNIINQLAR